MSTGKDSNEKSERYTIQSIDKALDMIEVLAEHGSLSLIELTELLNQPKSSTYRIVLTLEHRGFISRSDDDGKYCLGYKQLLITRNLLERNNLRKAAYQEMKKLSEHFGDTVNLGVLLDGQVMYVEIIESTHALRMTDSVGSKSPIHATAMGKVMAAYYPKQQVLGFLDEYGMPRLAENTITEPEHYMKELEKVRSQGYSVDDQEVEEGARCVAAPIFNMFGKVHGAISLSGPMHRYHDDAIPEIARQIIEAAGAVSLKMGFAGAYPTKV